MKKYPVTTSDIETSTRHSTKVCEDASSFFTRRSFALMLTSSVLGVAWGQNSSSSGANEMSRQRIKAGAFYFDGWSRLDDTKHLTARLTGEFGSRRPVWGWLDDTLEIMEKQIGCAADAGLGFFAFDWYSPERNKQTPLNHALSLYLKAGNRERLEFCLLVANEIVYGIGPENWSDVCKEWLELFSVPTYMKVAGRPLLIFFSPRRLLDAFGGAFHVKSAFEDLKQQAKERGLPGVTIAACGDMQEGEAAGFDLFTGYNYHGAGRHGNELERPFSELIDESERIWNFYADRGSLRYIPVVTSGWDKRPWEESHLPEERLEVYYPRTPEQLNDFMKRAIKWLDRHPDRTPSERLILIYAWNELGEGGYVLPTIGDGGSYLKAITMALQKDGDIPKSSRNNR